MGTFLIVVVLCISTAFVQARGPLCLNCQAVASPHHCKSLTECWAWESCYAEHFLFTNGSEAFTSGCRPTLQCNQTRGTKRFELKLCDSCCTGDLCNNNICTNGTAPPSGTPCLECTGASSPVGCSQFTYCPDTQICFTEKSSASPNPVYNMGCVQPEVCTFFEEEIIGKRSSRDQKPCHECCEAPGCNYGACSGTSSEVTTAATPPQTTVPTTGLPTARDCWDLRHNHSVSENGIYQVSSPDGRLVNVRCDMKTDGGGWIVFQKRFNGSIDFDQSYEKYRTGFGILSNEFWMGNDLLHEFTKDKKQKLRVDICSWPNTTRHAVYDFFTVGPASDKYRLGLAGYHGNAGDALITGSGADQYHNNRRFSTPDSDNDASSSRHCAREFRSGWWFGSCFSANLNGEYQPTGPIDRGVGLQWRPWAEDYSFKGTEMKFRPADANPSSAEAFHCPVH